MKPTVTILLEEYDRLRNEVSNISKTIQSLKDDYQKNVRHNQKWYQDKAEEYRGHLSKTYFKSFQSKELKINELEKTINSQKRHIESLNIYCDKSDKRAGESDKKAGLYLILLILSLALLSGTVCALIFIK